MATKNFDRDDVPPRFSTHLLWRNILLLGEVAQKESNLFSNKKIILTGFRDDAIINFIKANNGKLSKSVSNDLYMIIHNQIPSKKPSKTYDFGVQNNITLMSKNDFLKKYME